MIGDGNENTYKKHINFIYFDFHFLPCLIRVFGVYSKLRKRIKIMIPSIKSSLESLPDNLKSQIIDNLRLASGIVVNALVMRTQNDIEGEKKFLEQAFKIHNDLVVDTEDELKDLGEDEIHLYLVHAATLFSVRLQYEEEQELLLKKINEHKETKGVLVERMMEDINELKYYINTEDQESKKTGK